LDDKPIFGDMSYMDYLKKIHEELDLLPGGETTLIKILFSHMEFLNMKLEEAKIQTNTAYEHILKLTKIHPPRRQHCCPEWDGLSINEFNTEFQSCSCDFNNMPEESWKRPIKDSSEISFNGEREDGPNSALTYDVIRTGHGIILEVTESSDNTGWRCHMKDGRPLNVNGSEDTPFDAVVTALLYARENHIDEKT